MRSDARARTEEEEHSSVSSTAAKVVRSAGGTRSDGSLLDGKKERERENAPDRKDSRHSSSPSVVKGGWVGFPLFPACVWPVEN